jgi:hypothetical protein
MTTCPGAFFSCRTSQLTRVVDLPSRGAGTVTAQRTMPARRSAVILMGATVPGTRTAPCNRPVLAKSLTTALPVKHPSRVRGADQWTGPGNDLAARFGRDAAHAEWFYGFRLAVKTDLGTRIVRAWSIVPAAVRERGTAVLVPPDKGQRAAVPPILRKVIAEWRNRVETTFSEITVQMELARHGAHTFWGLLTRTAATIAAHTLLRVCLTPD